MKNIFSNQKGKLGMKLLTQISLLSALFFLGACVTNGTYNPDAGLGAFKLLGGNDVPQTNAVTLPLDRNHLINSDQEADGNDILMQFHNVMELDRQKRFTEARFLLSEIRGKLDPDSDGHKSVTCSIAIVSLKAGDYPAFMRAAQQLDLAIGEPVNVPAAYVEVVSIYRVLGKKQLPVNVPERIKQFGAQMSWNT